MPNRLGPEAVRAANSYADDLPAEVALANRRIASVAAALRAAIGPTMKLPDALVVATAEVLGADRILTTDQTLRCGTVPVLIIGRS